LEEELPPEAMEFRFVITFSILLQERQCFCQHRESCFWLPDDTVCLGEERKVIRSCYFCACSTLGYQALVYLLDPFLHLSPLCQRPAA
jgi:hypothetical protein